MLHNVAEASCRTVELLGFMCFVSGLLATPALSVQGSSNTTDRDPYGGWKHLTFQSTGFFYVTERDGVWWLVTPQGNAFLSKGVNNVSFRADNAPALGYSPYERAVQDKYGSQDAWAEAVVTRLRGWGSIRSAPGPDHDGCQRGP
ncbi:MAG: hypothetical protein JW955_00410 [Sedimentisphaerales bacterium]|nr:hypothetical protein [Sedimentisphaerales bacterium]